ncbi:MAG TPA: galactokinase [bacterium (Candidatus Stahlbacteria)]|nr:galactokinase [Candidatus Stahlbacteria bacterium]
MTDSQLIAKFEEIYGKRPSLMVKAPGRVNLIGEHTDYNDGFVLPMAINRYSVMLASQRNDRVISIYAENYDSLVRFPIDNIEYDNEHKWSNYQRGVIKVLKAEGYDINGMDALLWGDVPVGAGLSSSASVEAATVLTLNALWNLNISPLNMIKFAKQTENEFVGVNCGIMDQFAAFLSKRNHALLLDCRSLEHEYIPVRDARFIICDTRVRRELSNSSYNERREECREGVKVLRKWLPNIETLRDVKVENFIKYREAIPLPVRNRVEHVVKENDRVLKGARFLKAGKFKDFGELMYESHNSLKNLYEVSCYELDLLVDIARETNGVLGARMTGAGFGGCVIVLIEDKVFKKFKTKAAIEYKKEKGLEPNIFVVEASDGARASFLI